MRILLAAALTLATSASGASQPPPGGTAPVWSPDGKRIVYIGPAPLARATVPSMNRVLTVAADGAARQVVATAPREQTLDEVRLAAGGRLVYADSNYTLWTVASPGSKPIRLGDVGVVGNPLAPFAVSPDGRFVALTAPCECGIAQGTVVETVASAGGRLRRLSRVGGYAPSFSPDGTAVVLTGAHSRLVVMPPTGGRARFLGVRGTLAAWSPDGRWIAYQGPKAELEVIPAAGGKPRVLVPSPIFWRGVVAFSWSPDSTRLVYDTQSRLGTVDLAGTTRTLVLPRGVRPGLGIPQWSPDGKAIAFAGIHEQVDFGVYVVEADGTDLRRIT